MTEAPKMSIAWLLGIYVALIVLLLLTVGGAHLSLGRFALFVALAIAVAKALLVIIYFMHIRYSSKVTWIFAGAGFLWLAIFFTLTFGDYLTRSWLPRAQDITARASEIPPPPGYKPSPGDPTLHQDYQASPYEHPH